MVASLTVSTAPASSPSADDCVPLRSGWVSRQSGLPELVIVNRIAIQTDGHLRWNGVAITRNTLGRYLRIVRTMTPMPFTILDPDPNADCATIDAVRDDMEALLPCAQGYCGEGHGSWGYANNGPPDENSEAFHQAERDIAEATARARAEYARPRP